MSGTWYPIPPADSVHIDADGSAGLAGCGLTRGKAGKECAELCYQIYISNPYVTKAIVALKWQTVLLQQTTAL